MSRLSSFFKSWKTLVVGAATIALTFAPAAYPKYAPQIAQVVGVLTGLGFIAAKDADKTGFDAQHIK